MGSDQTTLATLAAGYGSRAVAYEAMWHTIERYSPFVADFLERRVRPGCTVLDVACGPGHLTRDLDPLVNVVGFDLTPEMIELAHAARRHGRYHVHDFHAPWPPVYADVLVCVGALDFCYDLDAVLGHIAAAVRPGGALLLTFANRGPGDPPRLAISPGLPGVDMMLYSVIELFGAFDAHGLLPRTPRFAPGYHSDHHAREIGYSVWELTRA
jgi:malonyl-CoA O-methyltransferase